MATELHTAPSNLLSRLGQDIAELSQLAPNDHEVAAAVQETRRLVTSLRTRHPNLFTAPTECCGNPERCFEACGDLPLLETQSRD